MLSMLHAKGVRMRTRLPRTLTPVVTCVADGAAMAGYDRALLRRLARDEKERIIASQLATWVDPDVPRSGVEIRALVWDRCQGKCVHCGRLTNPFRDFTIDHLRPQALGGGDDIENLAGSCRACNSSKGARRSERWTAL